MLKRLVLILLILASAGVAAAETIALKSGITMRYVAAGAKDAPPLVLLHGLGDTNRSWSLMLPELAKTHRVYALDQRGHGATSAPPCCYALANFAYDAILFMDAMKIERASVVGHSLGSFVAQHLAAHYPDRVEKLVLIGSADTTMGLDVMEWAWQQILTFGDAVPSSFVDEWQSNPTPVDAEFLAHVKKETAAVPPHVWKGIAREVMTLDQRRFLREIRTPALILWGENDSVFALATQQRLLELLPHATFKRYEKVGHNLHWEIPGRAAEDLRTFLSPLPAASPSP